MKTELDFRKQKRRNQKKWIIISIVVLGIITFSIIWKEHVYKTKEYNTAMEMVEYYYQNGEYNSALDRLERVTLKERDKPFLEKMKFLNSLDYKIINTNIDSVYDYMGVFDITLQGIKKVDNNSAKANELGLTKDLKNMRDYYVSILDNDLKLTEKDAKKLSEFTGEKKIEKLTETYVNISEPVQESESKIVSDSSEENNSFYTREHLENDPLAPSTNPNDYDENGQYVPEYGVSDNPADYNSNGEYKPIESMSQEELQRELEDMLGGSLGVQ